TGREVHHVTGGSGEFFFSRDGKALLVPGAISNKPDAKPEVRDLELLRVGLGDWTENKQLLAFPVSMGVLAIAPDERTMLAWLSPNNERGNRLALWDLRAGKEIRALDASLDGFGYGAAFGARRAVILPGGRTVVTRGRDGVNFWEAGTGR